ncbi:MAG: hypothetical protein OHK0010_31050 [Anaerolineales bacterium]
MQQKMILSAKNTFLVTDVKQFLRKITKKLRDLCVLRGKKGFFSEVIVAIQIWGFVPRHSYRTPYFRVTPQGENNLAVRYCQINLQHVA